MLKKSKKEYQKEYRLKNREKIKEYRLKNKKYFKEYRLNNKEKINKAGKEYRLNNREKILVRQGEYRLNNKEKIKQQYLKNKNKESFIKQRHQYYLNHKEYIKGKSDDWRINNKERYNARTRKYCADNNEKHTQWRRDYYKKNSARIIAQNARWSTLNYEVYRKAVNIKKKQRLLNDPNYKLLCNLRGRIYGVLKGKSKSASTMELLGCTIEELWIHLESKFEPWMTRENYGKGGWDVDHIKACANFDLTDPAQQRICFHYTNLQPMEHIANIKKGTR